MAENGQEYIKNALLAYNSTARHSKTKDQIVNVCIVFYNENYITFAKELFLQ